ncbi:MAG: hypothetical protein QM539_09970, partial [Alphaproteobacteria bacterium]|nr:hypothetical protein [Alphaproteobacteria bacterium]
FFYLLIQKIIKNYTKEVIYLGASFIIGFFVIGYSTYTRNWIEHGHVFFPVYGNGHGPMVAAMDYYEQGNQIINFFKAIFAKTGFGYYMDHPIIYKIPFTFNKYELERYGFAGTMVGGFGVWFSAIFLMYCAWLIYIIFSVLFKKITFDLFSYLAFIIIILASCLINPHAYIARYSPQFYLIPISLFYIHFILFKKFNFFVKIYMGILVINCLLICGYLLLNYQASKIRHQQVESFKNSNKILQINFNHHVSNRFLFQYNQIPFIFNDSLQPTNYTKKFYQSELIIK